MTYLELKKTHSKEISDFPMFFAFNQQQFEQGLEKIGATKEEIVHIGAGGYMKQEHFSSFQDMLERHEQEHQAKMLNDEDYAYHMMKHELANHEYVLTGDLKPSFEACHITTQLLNRKSKLKNAVNRAIEDYQVEVI